MLWSASEVNNAMTRLSAIEKLSDEMEMSTLISPFFYYEQNFNFESYSAALQLFKGTEKVNAIINALSLMPCDRIISISEVIARSDSSRYTVERFCKTLIEANLMQAIKVKAKNTSIRGRGRICYIASSNVDMASLIAAKNKSPLIVSTPKKIISNVVSVEPSYAVIDNLICGALAPCLPISSIVNARFESTIHWFGKPLSLSTKSIHGEFVAEINDLKTYIAILSCTEVQIRDCIDAGKDIPLSFSVYLKDIINARYSEKVNQSNNIKAAGRLSIDRLRNTKFEITDKNNSFDQLIGLDNVDAPLMEINPLSNVIFSVSGTEAKKIVMVSFQLPDIIRAGLIDRVKNQKNNDFNVEPLSYYKQDPLLWILKKQLNRLYKGHEINLTTEQLKEMISQPSDNRSFRARIVKAVTRLPSKSNCDSPVFSFNYENILGSFTRNDNKWNFIILSDDQIVARDQAIIEAKNKRLKYRERRKSKD